MYINAWLESSYCWSFTQLFRVLRDQWGENFDSFISRKVVVIPGDVSLHNLGLKDEELKIKMLEEINVIVNLAGTSKFEERFHYQIKTNFILFFCLPNKFDQFDFFFLFLQVSHLNGCKYNVSSTCIKLRKELS